MAKLTLEASTECALYCNIIRGDVSDVCDVRVRGDMDGEVLQGVVFVDNHGAAVSEALMDLGDDNNVHYLDAVRKCAGAPVEKTFGIRRRSGGCSAKIGEFALGEYKLER